MIMRDNNEDLYPSISIVVPTYQEEKNIETCLRSIFTQDYDEKRLEVIVVDNYSTDKTVSLAQRYPVKILYNKVRDAEVSKIVGLRKCRNDLFVYLDADVELVGKNWLKKLVEPLIRDETIVAAFPRFVPKKGSPPLARFLRYHPLELDPVFQFFCTEIRETIIEKRGDFDVCEFSRNNVPPIGICVYRRSVLLKAIKHMEKFMDIDIPAVLADKGFNRFAYVSQVGIFHTNVESIRELVQQKLRNLNDVYLPNLRARAFRYFDLRSKRDIIKIIWWVIYANLFFPLLVKGAYKSIRNRDLACMYEPVAGILLTDSIVWALLLSGEGRNLIREGFKLK